MVTAAERRVEPLLFGVVLFLASELMFFGGLFAAYFFIRAGTSPWPPDAADLETLPAAIATAMLVASSGTFQLGVRAARTGNLRGFRVWTVVTFVLGVAFLGIQAREWTHLPFEVSTNAYGTLFYGMTGFHGLHVIGGLVLMLVVLGRAAQGAYHGGEVTGIEATAYYWHFVDVVWLGLFATLFLIR
jgi:cytochrome c oxidase subunit III